MPKIRPLNTISNYNRLFRSMIKNQLKLKKKSMNRSRELSRSRTPNRTRTHSRSRAISRPRQNLTNHTRKVYEELKELQIQQKAKNQANRMAAKKASKMKTKLGIRI
jgi:hypothetical protein